MAFNGLKEKRKSDINLAVKRSPLIFISHFNVKIVHISLKLGQIAQKSRIG